MSQRDLVAELRAARIEAPAELRDRVRLIAAADTSSAERRRITWRRALVVALPVAAAVAATIVLTRPDHTRTVVPVDQGFAHGSTVAPSTPAATPELAPSTAKAIAPNPSTTRVQRYGAYLALRVPTPDGVSNGVKQALAITKSLGGYAGSVHAVTSGSSGSADLTLKIPRTKVQQAIARLSALGTITAEQVNVQDLQAGVNVDRADDRPAAAPARRTAGATEVGGQHRPDRGARSPDRRPPALRSRDDPRGPVCDGRPAPRHRCPGPREGPPRPATRARRRVSLARDRRRLRAGARRPLRPHPLARLDRRANGAPAPRRRPAQPFVGFSRS